MWQIWVLRLCLVVMILNGVAFIFLTVGIVANEIKYVRRWIKEQRRLGEMRRGHYG